MGNWSDGGTINQSRDYRRGEGSNIWGKVIGAVMDTLSHALHRRELIESKGDKGLKKEVVNEMNKRPEHTCNSFGVPWHTNWDLCSKMHSLTF